MTFPSRPSQADVSDYYDLYWSESPGDRHWADGTSSDRLLDELDTRVHPGTRVLDFGCGDASRYGRWLADRADSYLGLDVSEVALSRATESDLEVIRIESESDLGVPPEAFDLAIAHEVLEHLFAPQEAVRELHRALTQDGILIATVPNVGYWVGRVRLGILGRWNPTGDQISATQPWRDPHLRFFTLVALRDLIRGAGFSEVAVSAHNGAFVMELPLFRRFSTRRASALYRRLEARFPSLFGARLMAIARKA